jgi:hypothetical protein
MYCARMPAAQRPHGNCCDASGKSDPSGVIFTVDTFDVSNIVKRSWAVNGLMSSAALLWPIAAVPESRVQSEGASTAVQAAAHVNFRIVIPKVLYLHIGVGDANPETVAVMSNSRNVWLTATVRTREDHPRAARGNVILSASGRNIIAQNTLCTAVDLRSAAVGANRVICTVSMP